jgi:uncharacterized protein (DUF2252 family)
MPRSTTPLSDLIHGHNVEERIAAGKTARTAVPRSAIGTYTPSVDRPDPIAILTEQETHRVQELIPLRHQRMSANPFAFLRGAAAVMAADLGSRPHTGLYVQLCGDAHMSNLGIFAGPDRSLVFDINDFDETAPGPFEWDVFRLATSFEVAAQQAGHSVKFSRTIPGVVATAYRDSMSKFATMNNLDTWYYRIDSDQMRYWAERADQSSAVKRLNKTEATARARDRWSAVRKLTHVVDGTRRFIHDPPLLASLGLEGGALPVVEAMFNDYKSSLQIDRQELLNRYRIVDVGHKVVGVGSVGLLAFVVLLEGRDSEDLLVLQIKEAVDSVLSPFTGLTNVEPSGKRVVTGQQLMQASSDAFLGWVVGPRGRAYYVRQLRDMKWSPDPGRMSAQDYTTYAGLCGTVLARAHARAGDSVAISAYIGTSDTFAKSVSEFADAYADQNQRDFEAFTEAIDSDRVSMAEEGIDLGLVVEADGSVVMQAHATP